jgi:hypothetical protein
MNRFIILLILAVGIGPVWAGLPPPTRTLQPVADTSMIVMDRGAKLEIFPTKRAVAQVESGGREVAHRVMTASTDSAINAQQLGVIFNHAMQQQGYISGEIAFKMKAGLKLSGFRSSLYPGLKKITNPEVYVVNTRTPAEFMTVLKRLQARGDLEWVEPTVIYGPSKTGGSIQ